MVARAFAAALAKGDVGAASAFFAPGACLLTPDGTEITSRRGIESVLDQLVRSEASLKIRVGRTLMVGDTALASQFWTRQVRAADDVEPFRQTTRATLVLRLQAEAWAIAIAAPWG